MAVVLDFDSACSESDNLDRYGNPTSATVDAGRASARTLKQLERRDYTTGTQRIERVRS